MRIKVTDPCYVIDEQVWSEICDKAVGGGEEWSNNFDKLVTDYLKEKTGKDWACAGSTWYGDWSNTMSGTPVLSVTKMDFYADSGMWCVVPAEFNERHDSDPLGGAALLEFDDNSDIKVIVTTDNNKQWAEFEVHGEVNGEDAIAYSASYDEGDENENDDDY
jgi:hypothetical protein